MASAAYIKHVVRALNEVRSIGQARAALRAANDEISAGAILAGELSRWSSPTPEEANDTLILLRAAIDSELRHMGIQPDDAPVDEYWPRARRQIERVYIEVSGLVGVVEGLERADRAFPKILWESILAAPKVFAGAVGEVVGAAGEAAGKAAGGLAWGLGPWGWALVALVIAVVVFPRRLPV